MNGLVTPHPSLPNFPEVIDSTIRAAFANCFRKGYWEFIRKKRKPGGNIHQLFGGCFAKAMEVCRKSFYVHGLSQDDAITEGILAATDMWETGEGDSLVPQGRSSGANKTYAALIDAIDSYFVRWSMEDDMVVPLRLPNGELFIEKTFAFPVDGTSHPVTGNPILYAGRLDMLGEWKDTGLYVGVDEKSSGYLGESWMANWPMRGQLSGYCLTDEHEVLTPNGWVNISNITTSDKIAQWEENGKLTFVNPIEVHSLEYNGLLHNFEGKKVSLSATENHRQPVLDNRTKRLKTFFIENIPNSHMDFITTGQAHFGDWHPSKYWLQLLVAVQADGYFTDDGAINFIFSKQRKIDRLISILDNCDVKYTVNIHTKTTNIRLSAKNYSDIEEFNVLLRSNDTKEKKWGKWLLNLDNESMNIIIEETVFWDGRKEREKGGWRYFTSVKENAEWISTLACITGYTSSIYEVGFDNWKNKSDKWSPAYRVFISPRPTNMVRAKDKSITIFDGTVYCLTVPSSYFLVRKNGRHVVTGNCYGSSVYGYKIRHFHIRGIGILKNDITFAENIQNRADWQIDSWLVQVRRDINRAAAAYIEMCREQEIHGFDGRGMEKHWDQNFDSVCSSYNGCPYMDLCTSEHPDRWLRGNYVDVDWNPLREKE